MITDGSRDKYGEQALGRGITENGRVIEIWVNAKEGTWTILRHNPSGITCIQSSGKDWTRLNAMVRL